MTVSEVRDIKRASKATRVSEWVSESEREEVSENE